MISCQNDLSGELEEHFCLIDEDDIEEHWHRGVVLERHGKTYLFFYFLIRYNEKSDILFSRNIYSDFSMINLKFHLFRSKILFLQQLNINILMIKQRKTSDGMLKWVMSVWKVLM